MPEYLHAAVPTLPEGEQLSAVVVLADREYGVPLSRFASDDSREHHRSVTTETTTPEAAMRGITDGDAADIYITSYPGISDQLAQRGLIDVYATTPLGEETLVLVANRAWWEKQRPAGWQKTISTRHTLPEQLRPLPDVRLVMGDPARIASGRMASDLLMRQRWQTRLAAQISYTLATSITLQRAAQPGNVALVYASDTQHHPEIITIAEFAKPLQAKAPIMGHVIAGERMDTARSVLTDIKHAMARARTAQP